MRLTADCLNSRLYVLIYCLTSLVLLQVQEPALLLPSTVFATKEETDIGLLNKAVAVKGRNLVCP